MPIDLGGGGGSSFFGQTLTATASGAIADGDPVILNADGTVSAVSATAVVVGQPGETMFIVGSTGDAVYRYNLGTAFDVSTASYSGDSFSVAAQESTPRNPFFSSDGTKMFVIGGADDDVNEYALTIPYDITTASYTQNFSVAAQEATPGGLAFSPDGLKMFVVGTTSDAVFEYNLSSGFDLSTASYSGTSFSVASQEASTLGLAFNTNGTKMFVVGITSDTVFEYDLSSGFDVSTASYSGTSLSISAQDTAPTGISFNPSGTKMFIIGAGSDAVYEYDLSSGFDLSTASYSGTSFSVASQDVTPLGITFGGTLVGTNLTTADDYIGIADGAYADSTTATIQLVGSVDDAQSGLTPGAIHYVQTDGSLSTTPDTPEVEAGYAISATELLVKGAYSTITVTLPKPTPLADATPRIFGAAGNTYLYEGSSTYYRNTSNFWNMIDLQGAYITATSPISYTEIVNVTGSGWLGTILVGLAGAALHETFVEVVIDAEVREFKFLQSSRFGGIIDFSPINLLERSSTNHVFSASNSLGAFSSPYTTPYSTLYTQASTSQDTFGLQPTVLTGGLRFKSNMKVRIKSATSFSTFTNENRHGVLYALDS